MATCVEQVAGVIANVANGIATKGRVDYFILFFILFYSKFRFAPQNPN